MIKGWIITISILLLLFVAGFIGYSDYMNKKSLLTGETVTGEATNSNFAVAVSVIIENPEVNITRPENKTYVTGKNLRLNYSARYTDDVWYSIDNVENITLTGNITFNTTNGVHIIRFYGNNSEGDLALDNVTFNVDTNRLKIKYEKYHEKGSSTDFNDSYYEDLQNLSNIILEIPNWGKIRFYEDINLTADSNFDDNETDLDSYTNISENNIEINSTTLPNLNNSATLYLYNLTFTNPRVLRDGSVCPSTICTEIGYSGGTFIFNVTYFSNYVAEETPSETTAPSGGGGGGTTKTLFTVDKSQISVSLTPGQVKTENITITNTGKNVITVGVDNLIPNFIARGEDLIILNPGESKVVPLYILARVETIPNLYLGKIIISSGSIKKEILIAIEVESEGVLLDARAGIMEDYKDILPGEKIVSEIRLFNLGDPGRKDIFIEYSIKDYDGNEIVRETESLAIETQTTFVKEISIPKSAKLGEYILYVKATYEGKIASASDNFEIVSSKITDREKVYIIIIIVLPVIISLIFYLSIRHSLGWQGKKSKGTKKERRIELRSILKN